MTNVTNVTDVINVVFFVITAIMLPIMLGTALWIFVAPMRLRLAILASVMSFRVVWRAWREGRVVSWDMQVGPVRAGFESLFGYSVYGDNIKARAPKIGEQVPHKPPSESRHDSL